METPAWHSSLREEKLEMGYGQAFFLKNTWSTEIGQPVKKRPLRLLAMGATYRNKL
jgi:hypothetical protein